MKKLFFYFSVTVILIFCAQFAFSQCTPLDAETCPDTENNGEICPDTLAPVYVGVEYNQTATILAPPKIDTGNITVLLHHITLVSVDNLPEGITWVTNAIDNEFYVGTYYCILLSGTSYASVGDYPLKIVVDVYTSIGGTPIYLGQSIDSTSLSIHVGWDPNGIPENGSKNLISKVRPNPFSSGIFIDLAYVPNEKINLELYNVMGIRLYHRELNNMNNPAIKLETADLPDGMYLLSLEYQGKRYMQRIIKND